MIDVRELRGKAIARAYDQIKRIDRLSYLVKSQSGRGSYSVHLDSTTGWHCSCPDHVYRDAKCKHVWACTLSAKLRDAVKPRVIEPIDVHACLYCYSPQIVKVGIRHNRHGNIQKFRCKICGHYFTINLGFERMKHNPQGITTAMQLYFSGESLRNTAKSLKLIGVEVSHKTVYCWIRKYVELMDKYLAQIKTQVSDTWRADEMYLKVKGNPKYLYALLDDQTRFWIAKEVAGDKMSREATDYASRLFQLGKETAGKKPLTLITDGLKAYHLAYKREFFSLKGPRTEHLTWEDGKVDNRKMESFNGNTVRVREKVMRSLKTENSPILNGMQIFHNYVRPHEALEGKTPADACGIEIQGENKWLTLIQNASSRGSRPNVK